MFVSSLALLLAPVHASATTEDSVSTIYVAQSEQPQAAGLIVELATPEITDKSIEVIEDKADVEIVEVADLAEDVQVVEFSEVVDAATVEDAVVAAEARSDVVSAEPNWIIQRTGLPTDDYSAWAGDVNEMAQPGLWDNDGPNFSINAPELWKYTTGTSSITVAVIDTGILPKHPDLAGRLLPGYDFISNKYVARDGNGWDSNPSDAGDWQGANASSWHGTAVASLIAANADSRGIVGVAPNVKILPVRVLGAGGGTISDLAAGIRWAAGEKVYNESTGKYLTNKYPAKVINLSLAANIKCSASPTLQSAVTAAQAKGAVLVAARGNDAWNLGGAYETSPSSCDGVIGVAASNESGQRSSYSNYGGATDLAAPGGAYQPNSQVWVASNSGTQSPSSTYNWKKGMGTSYSTPLVSGGAALMFAMGYGKDAVNAALGGSDTPATAVQTAVGCWGCGAGILDLSKITPPDTQTLAYAYSTISGTNSVGSVLTGKSNWTGTLKPSYQWYRGGVAIDGATNSTYKLVVADLGSQITLQTIINGVTLKPSGPSIQIEQANEAFLSVTKTIVPPKASISGTMKYGKTLQWGSTTLKANWPSETDGIYQYSYQWYNNGNAIASKYGGKNASYKLRYSDRGDLVKVKVTIKKVGLDGVQTYSYSSTSSSRRVSR